jgi:uncharacterized membrane protein YjfL (UPF0719 family)
MKFKLFVAFVLAAVMPNGIAFAQEAPSVARDLAILSFISTLVYGLIGIALAVFGYFVFDRLLKLDLRRELVEDQNMALGIMLAGVFIGISIVVGAVMIS